MRFLIMFLLPILAFSVPSNWKAIKTFTQPDGTQFEGRLIGDEHYSFVEDLEGYVYVRDAAGWWVYAQLENGLLMPTASIAFRDAPVASPHIRPSVEAISELPENRYKTLNRHFYDVEEKTARLKQLGKENASYEERSELLGLTGQNTLLCLLARFSDSSFGWTSWETASSARERRHFWGIAFGDSVPPYQADSSTYSMNNYYWEATYAKLKWTGNVDTIRNSGYTRVNANSDTPGYAEAACDAADASIDFSLYDDDGNGYVDQLFIIHPGMGEEESGIAQDIWSASYTGVSFGPYDGVRINRFVVVPENAKLGVFCHELFHQFANAPDLYDYGYDGDPVADFCLMASGSWNGDPGGTKPSHPCGLLKLETDGEWPLSYGGWLPAAVVKDTSESATCGKYNITQFDSTPGSARNYERLYLVRNSRFQSANQMLIMENRQQTGTYESGLPRSGLLINHLDRGMVASRLNDGPPGRDYYYYFTERNLFDPHWYYYLHEFGGLDTTKMNPNDFYAAYAADYGYTNFDSLSIPNNGINTKSGSAPTYYGPKITAISQKGFDMSFNIAGGTVPPAGPAVKVHSHVIKDPITTGVNNDNNGLFNAGELDTLILTFYSSGSSATGTVTESLYTTDPHVTIVNPHRCTLGVMANNTFANDGAKPYLIRIAFNAPSNYTVQFKYKVWGTAYSDSGALFTGIGKPYVAYRFRPGSVTHPKFRPMAIAASADTLFVSDGDSLPPLAGTWNIYKFNTNTNTLIGSYTRPCNQSYIGAGDIKGDTLFWSIGDSVVRTGRSISRINAFRHHNSTWGSNIRARGVSIAPVDAPITYGGDSLFVYWQNYGASNNIMEESLKMVSRPTSGTSAWRRSWVIPEGGNAPDDHWRNGRGLEHDGWRIWRICLFTDEIYRSRAPAAAGGSIDTLFVMRNPNHWGAYPGYDIDFQGRSATGGAQHVPYARGNKFYLWTTNIDNSEIFRVDVTSVVHPTPVKNVTALRSGQNNLVIWDEKNHGANPDSVDKTTRYIIYRTHSLVMDELGDSIGFLNARTTCARDTFTDYNPALRSTTVYYRVSAVNYFGFIPGHSNRSPGVIGIEEGTSKPLTFMFYTISPSIVNRRLFMKYETAEPCEVDLRIYNAMGALVRKLLTGNRKPGVYDLIWDMRDDESRNIANGIYFVKFSTNKDYERTQKIILVR